MAKAAFDKIAEGLTEALEITRGSEKPYRLHVPAEIDARIVRGKAHMSQDQFASAFGFTIHQIRQWEQGRVRPLGAMRAYLMLIAQDPHMVLDHLHAAATGKSAQPAQSVHRRRTRVSRDAQEYAHAMVAAAESGD